MLSAGTSRLYYLFKIEASVSVAKENSKQAKFQKVSSKEVMEENQNDSEIGGFQCWKRKKNPFNSIWFFYFMGFLILIAVAVIAYIGIYHIINCKSYY